MTSDSAGRRSAKLTDREREVLAQVADGKPLLEIARTLNCSQNTLTNHLRNIIDKLTALAGG